MQTEYKSLRGSINHVGHWLKEKKKKKYSFKNRLKKKTNSSCISIVHSALFNWAETYIRQLVFKTEVKIELLEVVRNFWTKFLFSLHPQR